MFGSFCLFLKYFGFLCDFFISSCFLFLHEIIWISMWFCLDLFLSFSGFLNDFLFIQSNFCNFFFNFHLKVLRFPPNFLDFLLILLDFFLLFWISSWNFGIFTLQNTRGSHGLSGQKAVKDEIKRPDSGRPNDFYLEVGTQRVPRL